MVNRVPAIAPVIVSASRSTDIPAFYGEWFMHRLNRGYVRWVNPWNRQGTCVSFARTRAIAFWSKNPAPFLPHIPTIDAAGFSTYFLFTLNDYDAEGLEPGIPRLADRVMTFTRLSELVGPGRVVWRFDPLIVSDTLTVRNLLDRVCELGDRISPFTRRLVFSFVDIARYPRVRRNLEAAGCSGAREFTSHEVRDFCTGLQEKNKEWGMHISACGEGADLLLYGIHRGGCISPSLLAEEFPGDTGLQQFLYPAGQQPLPGDEDALLRRLKDPGQRRFCGCIASKDIGQYGTCPHLCSYCYANTSQDRVRSAFTRHQEFVRKGRYPASITGD
jgi:hypothetical protein